MPMVTVRDLMKTELASVGSGTTVKEVARIMKTRKIGSVFVEQDRRIIGIVTEPDIVRKAVSNGRELDHVRVEEIMSSPVIGIDKGRPVTEAAELMCQHETRHLAVLTSGSIAGVLSVRDMLHPISIDEL